MAPGNFQYSLPTPKRRMHQVVHMYSQTLGGRRISTSPQNYFSLTWDALNFYFIERRVKKSKRNNYQSCLLALSIQDLSSSLFSPYIFISKAHPSISVPLHLQGLWTIHYLLFLTSISSFFICSFSKPFNMLELFTFLKWSKINQSPWNNSTTPPDTLLSTHFEK